MTVSRMSMCMMRDFARFSARRLRCEHGADGPLVMRRGINRKTSGKQEKGFPLLFFQNTFFMSGGMNLEQDAIVRIRSLNKTFTGSTGKVTALDGIDLDIRRGEIFGIIGLSGAGKSTLVRCINFLEKPTAGTVTVDGQELGSLSKKQLLEARRSMGMIFQQFNLLQQRTALQNICFPLEIAGTSKADAEKRAKELLEIVGLSDRAGNYPAVSSSASPSPVRSRPVRRSCFATRRPARLIRRPPARSSPCSRRSTGPSASPSSSSRTRWRSSRRSASASPSSTPAASLRSAR